MISKYLSLRVNPSRLRNNFISLAKIGNTDNGGIHRPTFSPAHFEARDWFKNKSIEYEFEFKIDGAGNHSALLNCGNPQAPTLIIGSHLDSVFHGGRFDGSLGILAGLEVARVILDENIPLPVHLEVIDFTDEEGTLVGLLGSATLTGNLNPLDLRSPRGGRDNLINGLKEAGQTENGLFKSHRDPKTLAGYLELHIEQGKRLEKEGADIGVVSSIVGIISSYIKYFGRRDHAGTTPLLDRQDASLGASAFTIAAREQLLKNYPDCVVNVGNMTFLPGVFNIVPSQVTVSLEFRAPTDSSLTSLKSSLINLAQIEAERFQLELKCEILGIHNPSYMDKNVQLAISSAAKSLDLKEITLTSGAGHDAQLFSDLCPTGMIFVPSLGGYSHSPKEFTHWKDCINGANVLLHSRINMMFASTEQ